MGLLIVQLLLSTIASITSIIGLLKEFRRREKVAKKEAKYLLGCILVCAVFTIIFTIWSFYDAKGQQTELQNRLDKIDQRNEVLERQIASDNKALKNVIDQNTLRVISNTADKAVAASKELKSTADQIKQDIKGTNVPPVLTMSISDKILHVVFENKEDRPAYTNIKVINYFELLKCAFSSDKKFIDQNCFISNVNQQINLAMPSKTQLILEVPNAIPIFEINTYKIEAYVYIQKDIFVYQMFIVRKYNKFDVFVRILKKSGDKFVFYRGFPSDAKVNWESEFPMIQGVSEFYNKY